MAPSGLNRLNLKSLDNVLVRAKTEGWTELALVGPVPAAKQHAPLLIEKGWNPSGIFLLTRPLDRIWPIISLTKLTSLESLDLRGNRIGDAGAEAIAGLTSLSSLDLSDNLIGQVGGRAILDAWANPARADQRHYLDLRKNGDLGGLLPAEVLQQTDAQAIIAAWRQRKEQEALQEPLPPPDSAGEQVAHGVQVGTAADGRLTLVDPAIGDGARDDASGRELHGEVVETLDRLGEGAGEGGAGACRRGGDAGEDRDGDHDRRDGCGAGIDGTLWQECGYCDGSRQCCRASQDRARLRNGCRCYGWKRHCGRDVGVFGAAVRASGAARLESRLYGVARSGAGVVSSLSESRVGTLDVQRIACDKRA